MVAGVLSTGVALVYATSATSFAAENDAPASDLVRVSVTTDGKPADGSWTAYPALSGDGRLVAFESDASNLVPGDTNNAYDVFVRDVVAGTTSRVSLSGSGEQGNGYSTRPAISADGKQLAFRSGASNLVADDTNAKDDIFVRNLATGTVVRASLSNTGQQGNGNASSGPKGISSDGRYVTFWSYASNLVDGDTNDSMDLFLRDLVAGTTTRLNVATGTGEQGKGSDDYVEHPVSPLVAGRYVAFGSRMTNLVPGDTNGYEDVFVRDIVAGTTTRVSVSTDGTQTNERPGYTDVAISQDGQRVFFSSSSDDLAAGDTNDGTDVFLRDMVARTTTRVSLHPTGSPYTGGFDTSGSADSQRVVFRTLNRPAGLFVRDLVAGKTTQIDLPLPGTVEEENHVSKNPSMSADGRYVAFYSDDDRLIEGGTKGDIFLRRLAD